MQWTSTVRKLGRNDTRLIGRDSFLTGIFSYILALALLLRFALPALVNLIETRSGTVVDTTAFYPLFVAYIVLFAGALVGGMIVGFLMIDERDQHTLAALLVTPLPLPAYIAYRVLVPWAIAFAVIVLEMLIINLALVPLPQLLLLAAGGALAAPAVTLILATFSANKIQGYATLKVIGAGGLVIIAAWFVQPPLQYLVGLFPPYWIVKAYWLALAGDANWWMYLAVGVVLLLGVIWFMAKRFQVAAYRVSE